MKPNPKLDAMVKRPVQHLIRWGRQYPQLWREHDQRRQEMRKVSSWPKWCYAPHTVTAGCDTLTINALDPSFMGLVELLQGLVGGRREGERGHVRRRPTEVRPARLGEADDQRFVLVQVIASGCGKKLY